MTEGAVAKFMNMSDKLSFSHSLNGTHTAEEKKKRDDVLNGLAGHLANLEILEPLAERLSEVNFPAPGGGESRRSGRGGP
jgi:hypothetical protein